MENREFQGNQLWKFASNTACKIGNLQWGLECSYGKIWTAVICLPTVFGIILYFLFYFMFWLTVSRATIAFDISVSNDWNFDLLFCSANSEKPPPSLVCFGSGSDWNPKNCFPVMTELSNIRGAVFCCCSSCLCLQHQNSSRLRTAATIVWGPKSKAIRLPSPSSSSRGKSRKKCQTPTNQHLVKK